MLIGKGSLKKEEIMNKRFFKSLGRIAKKQTNTKVMHKYLEKMKNKSPLPLNQAFIFWGLTQIGSEEEPWSRVKIINWFVPVDKTRKCTPAQEEIYRRILHSFPPNKELNGDVKEYLQDILNEVPPGITSLLREKFNTICTEL